MSKSGIYAIISGIDGKVYIGQSTNVNLRLSDHFKRLRSDTHSNRHLQSAYNKYGKFNFHRIILEYCEEEKLNERESHYINFFNANDEKYGYNLRIETNGLFHHNENSKTLLREIKKDVSKTVYGFDLNGSFIQEWSSISACAMDLKINPCDVRRVISQKQRFAKGFVLNDKKEFRLRESERKNNYKNFSQ